MKPLIMLRKAIKFHNLTSEDNSGRYMQYPIVDPHGSQDPFHIRIMKHAGGSDHLPFLRSKPRVPGVHYMNWPDVHYHTSEDLTKYLDPTQLKRVAMITMCVSLVMANATPEDVLLLAGLTAGHAAERIGRDLTRAMELLRMAAAQQPADPDGLQSAYKEGLVLVRQAHRREAAAVRSNARLMSGDANALAGLEQIAESVVATEKLDVARLQTVYRAVVRRRDQPVVLTPALTEDEAAAAALYPRPTAGDPYVNFGRPGQPTMHPGQRQYALYDEEAKNFADGTRSILEIRDAISAELGPVEVRKVTEFFRALEALGQWELADSPY